MRAIFTGEVSFGLVSVPVKLYSATGSHDIRLHQVHDDDGGRIRYQRRCEVCGKKVEYKNIDKAYDDGEHTVVVTKDELAELPADESHEITIEQFVPNDQIDSLVLDTSYYLQPASKSSKSYVLLRRTLEQTSRVGVVTFTLRSRTRLGVLRVRDEVIVLQAMRWADELREPDFDIPSTRISRKEKNMASSLVDAYSEDFEPERFTDTYQEQLDTLIQGKLEHGEELDTEATFGETDEESGGDVVDLMEALKKSVDSRRTSGKSSTKSQQRSQSSGKKRNSKRKSA